MVDFGALMKDKAPPIEDDSLVGTLMSWTLPDGGHPKDAVQRECTYRIGEYQSTLDDKAWITFKLTSGGVTGYESVTLEDEKEVMLDTLGRFGNPKGSFLCCAGTKGSWHQQRIPHSEMMRVLKVWLTSKNLIIWTCMYCYRGVEAVSAKGEEGGWSYTVCDDCVED